MICTRNSRLELKVSTADTQSVGGGYHHAEYMIVSELVQETVNH